MAGRGGRGNRGATRSFSKEQLSLMGVVGPNDLPGLVTQPPPLYPPLDRRPIPITQSIELDYLLILRQVFIDNMQLSGSYLKMPDSNSNEPKQEIDKLVAQIPTAKETFDWRLFPSELRPKVLAKRAKKKVLQDKDIEQRLNLLEKLEEKSEESIQTFRTEDENEMSSNFLTDELDEDEEMDEGTDYANNYFESGEAYEEEDDNLEDGPIF